MDPISIGGLVTGLIGGIGSLFGAKKANKKLEALKSMNPAYAANPIAAQRLGMARSLLNARMPGTSAAMNSIIGNQANAVANVQRSATDSSQALAIASAMQGQTNQSLIDAGLQGDQSYFERLNYLTGAEQGQIAEDDKVFQDKVRQFQDLAQIEGAKTQNRQNAWNSLSNFGFGVFSQGMYNNGGIADILKRRKGVRPGAANTTQPDGGGGIPGMTPSQYRTFY